MRERLYYWWAGSVHTHGSIILIECRPGEEMPLSRVNRVAPARTARGESEWSLVMYLSCPLSSLTMIRVQKWERLMSAIAEPSECPQYGGNTRALLDTLSAVLEIIRHYARTRLPAREIAREQRPRMRRAPLQRFTVSLFVPGRCCHLAGDENIEGSYFILEQLMLAKKLLNKALRDGSTVQRQDCFVLNVFIALCTFKWNNIATFFLREYWF